VGDPIARGEPVDHRLRGFVGRGRQQQPAAWRAGQRDGRPGQHPDREEPLHLAGQILGQLDRTDLRTGAQQETRPGEADRPSPAPTPSGSGGQRGRRLLGHCLVYGLPIELRPVHAPTVMPCRCCKQ
jgi:hypothetical protein